MRWVVQAEEENLRIDRAIPEHIEESSRAQAKRWCEKGFVRVGGRTVRPSRHLHTGESVEVEVPLPEPAEPEPEDIPLDISYEDEDLLVIVKPPHMVVHPAPGHYSGTLVNALLHHCSDLSGIGDVARPGIVHRLDQGTSGLIVVAKNHSSHLSLTRQFAGRSVEKRYLALVHGSAPDHLRLEQPLGRDERDRKKISSRARRAKPATTEAEKLETLPFTTFLSVRIETGRTHQIRVHLSEAGFPVVGDRDYGRPRRPPRGGEKAFRVIEQLTRPALHAAQLGFRHPRSNEMVRFEAPLASDFQEVVDALRLLREASCSGSNND